MVSLYTNYSLPRINQNLANIDSSKFFNRYLLKVFKKGEILLLKNETPTSVYLIESGKVKTYAIDSDGCERIVSFHQKGEILPIGFAFWLVKKSHFFYEAYTKCSVRMVPAGDFINYLNQNANYLQSLYVKTVKQLLIMMNRVSALVQSSSLNKVALSLLYMPDQLGINKRPHKSKLNVSVTQQEIANLIGLTRETIGTELKELQKMKLINCSRKSYVIHMGKLRKYLDNNNLKQ